MYKTIIVVSQSLAILRKTRGLIALFFLIITKSILLPVRYQSVQSNIIMYIWPYKVSMRE